MNVRNFVQYEISGDWESTNQIEYYYSSKRQCGYYPIQMVISRLRPAKERLIILVIICPLTEIGSRSQIKPFAFNSTGANVKRIMHVT
jgi:hypothetical protein